MAGYINDYVLDNGLTVLDSDVTALVICSDMPTTYAEADSTYKLGSKASPTVSAPADATSGRKVTVSAITDGSVSATGTATHFALIDGTNSRLLVAQALASSQGVTDGNTFTLGAIEINFPDAA